MPRLLLVFALLLASSLLGEGLLNPSHSDELMTDALMGNPALMLASWLIVFLIVLTGADRVLSFWRDHLKEWPNPRDTYATREDLGCNVTGIKDDLKELRRELVEGQRNAALARNTIHEEVEEVKAMLAAVTEAVDTLKQQNHLAAMAKAMKGGSGHDG